MKLKELIATLNIEEVYKPVDKNIVGIAYHSQQVDEGDLFVCIKGYETDGHKYLPHAKENGAVVAIVEEIQEEIDIPQYRVPNTRIALAKLSSKYYRQPSTKLKMIGISATNGKTTTSYMTNAILEKHRLRTGLIGTVDIKVADTKIPADLTTPESLELQYYLNKMVNHDVSHVTMEVSSAAKEMHRVETVDFDIVTMNNISSEHIDTHGSFERYFEVKSRLITNAKQDSFAILNLDCPYSKSLIKKTKAYPITYSLENKDGHVSCKNLDLSTGRAQFTVQILKEIKAHGFIIKPQEFDVQLAVPGLHSVYNSFVAIVIALLENIPITTIQDALHSFSGVERRFQIIYEEDFMIIDDHFANRGNINVTLNTLTSMDYNNLHIVYAIRGNRGTTVNKENAETITDWAKQLGINSIIATKSVSNVSKYDVVADDEVEVFLQEMKKANIDVLLYDELPDAIHKSLTNALSGDLILFAGCQGMDDGSKIVLNQLGQATKTSTPTF